MQDIPARQRNEGAGELRAEVTVRPTPQGFVPPALFVDGVPCMQRASGTDRHGRRIYEVVPIEIPDDVPSMWWREGC